MFFSRSGIAALEEEVQADVADGQGRERVVVLVALLLGDVHAAADAHGVCERVEHLVDVVALARDVLPGGRRLVRGAALLELVHDGLAGLFDGRAVVQKFLAHLVRDAELGAHLANFAGTGAFGRGRGAFGFLVVSDGGGGGRRRLLGQGSLFVFVFHVGLLLCLCFVGGDAGGAVSRIVVLI